MNLLFSTSQLKHFTARPLRFKRVILPLFLLAGILSSNSQLYIRVLSDAFIQVSVFVAFTLYLYYKMSKYIPFLELDYVREHSPKLEIPIAALLGALPGCGGAIIVVTQFTKGKASFGSVVAVLTATMGDAAFLLIAKRTFDALIVLAIALIVGSLTGYLINRFSQHDFSSVINDEKNATFSTPQNESNAKQRITQYAINFWLICAIPSFMLAILFSFQIDLAVILDKQLIDLISYFCAFCGLAIIAFWSLSSTGESYQDITSEEKSSNNINKKIIQDTHFVTAWVVCAFLVYEIAVNYFNLNIATLLEGYIILTPLIAALIGLLPGCGPQILVTSLYLQGVVPFSALLANALSNDGDALFPAIALAPKAALYATFYSFIPAVVVAYLIYCI